MATNRCNYCGHTADWHRTEDLSCTHEIEDTTDSYIRCYCKGYRV